MARVKLLLGAIGAVLLFALMLITFVDVIGRNLFNHPLTRASEVTEVLLAGVIFVLLPQVALLKMHIVIDLIDSAVGRSVRAALDWIAGLLGAGMFVMITVQLWILGQKSAGYTDATPSLGLPLAPVLFFLATMSAITAVACLIANLNLGTTVSDDEKSEADNSDKLLNTA